MSTDRIHIDKFLQLGKQHLMIDVRSPAEYAHAHIPGAHNLPLFTDEERKIVGTAYKQQSREAAIKIGLDFFGPKMSRMVEEVEKLIGNRQSAIGNEHNSNGESHLHIANCLLIYCWRGGMRSAGVAWLLDLYGFKTYSLVGGYKKFRNYVLETFKLPFQFNILGGYTGSGKTEMLKALKDQGQWIVDLEEIARHKGSAFGKMGSEKQPSQEMFENVLALELVDKWTKSNRELAKANRAAFNVDNRGDSRVWLEDESQRIGDLNIPHELWSTIRQAPVYFFDIPFEKRLDRIVREYGDIDKENLIDSISRIQQRLGSLEARNAINHLHENNTVECFRILLKYYDKWYLKSLHNRKNVNSLLVSISCENVGLENMRALRQQATIS